MPEYTSFFDLSPYDHMLAADLFHTAITTNKQLSVCSLWYSMQQ